MQMEDKIVTLDSGKEYCILSETTYTDKKYCCAVEYDSSVEDIKEEYIIFEEVIDGDSLVLKAIDNDELEEYILLKIASENDEKEAN